MLVSPLDSGCIGISKSVKPLALAVTSRVHCFQWTWCQYVYLSLHFWLWSWIKILLGISAFFKHQAGGLCRLSLPERVNDTLPDWVIILTGVMCLTPWLPTLMAFPWVRQERWGTLSPEGHGQKYNLEAQRKFQESVFSHEPYWDDHLVYGLERHRGAPQW